MVNAALTARENRAIYRAMRILERRFKNPDVAIDCPANGKDYLRMRFTGLLREEFHAIWLNSQNQLIEAECLFVGTLTQTAVYPREVVRRAIEVNAAAVIFAHNHPSAHPKPSQPDIDITGVLKRALSLVDVKVLDHFIVTEVEATSLAESGHV